MFNGICTISQLSAYLAKYTDTSRRAPIAFDLLDEIANLDESLREKAYILIYDQMSIVADNRGKKRTFSGRYAEIDRQTASTLQEIFQGNDHITVYDMAASNGITSLDLYKMLKPVFPNIHFTVSDYFDKIYISTEPDSAWKVIFDAELNVLQAIQNGSIVPYTRHVYGRISPLRLLSWFIGVMIKFLVVDGRKETLKKALDNDNNVGSIELWHSRCIDLQKSDPNFMLKRDNLFEPDKGEYDFLRVMGTIPRLKNTRQKDVVQGLRSLVKERGLLLLCDNTRDINKATFFRKQNGRFTIYDEYGDGYPEIYKNYILND